MLDLTVTGGKARSTALIIDGKHVVVGGGGAIDLASEKIDVVLLPTAKDMTLAPLVAPVHLAGTLTDPQVMGDATDILSTTGHLLLGIVDPLSLATPVLHPERQGDMPCLDPAAFTGAAAGPRRARRQDRGRCGEDVGQGIGAAIKKARRGRLQAAGGRHRSVTGRPAQIGSVRRIAPRSRSSWSSWPALRSGKAGASSSRENCLRSSTQPTMRADVGRHLGRGARALAHQAEAAALLDQANAAGPHAVALLGRFGEQLGQIVGVTRVVKARAASP